MKPKRMLCRACLARSRDDQASLAEADRLAKPWGWTTEDVHRESAGALRLIGVPPATADATLDACADLPPDLVNELRQWADNPNGFLMLTGAAGSGKSWSAAAVLREVLTSGRAKLSDCRFVTEAAYLSRLRESYGQDTPARLLPAHHPHRVRLLVFDDLAATRLTDWGKGEIASLVCGRHADDLPTIVTSNLSLADIAQAIDPRVASRVGEGGQVLTFPARDLRLECPRRETVGIR